MKSLRCITLIIFIMLSACGGGGSGSGGGQSISLTGTWNGTLKARFYSCSGNIRMVMRETGSRVTGSVSGSISGASCAPQSINRSFSGSSSGDEIDLIDSQGDQWTLDLYDRKTITGQYFSERLILNFDVRLKR